MLDFDELEELEHSEGKAPGEDWEAQAALWHAAQAQLWLAAQAHAAEVGEAEAWEASGGGDWTEPGAAGECGESPEVVATDGQAEEEEDSAWPQQEEEEAAADEEVAPPVEETEEERLRREENEFFKKELELEVEVEKRIRQQEAVEGKSGTNTLGVTLRIAVRDPKEPKGSRKKVYSFLLDALNEALSTLYKLFGSKRRAPGLFLYGCQWQLNAFASFMSLLVQFRFNASSAAGFAERLAELFTSTGKEKGVPAGLCVLFKELLEDSPNTRRPVDQLIGLLDTAYKNILNMLRKLLACLTACGPDGKAYLANALAEFSKDFQQVQRPVPVVAEPIDPELQMHVALKTSWWSSPHEIQVSRQWSVEDLRMILLEAGFPHDVHLGPEGGGDFTCPSATPLEVAGHTLLLNTSDYEWLDTAVGGHEELYPYGAWGAASWVKSKIMKTTPQTATRLLYELRSAFQAAEFQARYGQLRKDSVRFQKGNVQMIEMTFGVQREVIPRYGFAASPKGVQEMRDEMAVHADFTVRDVLVGKVRKDIHMILDMFQPLPKLPIIRPITPQRFKASERDKWLRHLANEGFVVIANIASPDEVDATYTLLWDFIEAADSTRKVCRTDIGSWDDRSGTSRGWPAGRGDGIIHEGGIGQSRPLWLLRGLSKLKRVFADIWGTENLVTSFDGAGVFRPYGHNAEWRTKKANWHHVDQAHLKRGLHCVQGLVTLKDATERTGGLVVVPRSHRFHSELMRNYPPGKDNWDFVAVSANDKVITADSGGPRLVCARAGDLVLWDSRTIHCNTLPLTEDHELLSGHDLIRAVAYICMTPAAWCTEKVMSSRATSFQRGVTTSHWPHEHHSMSVANFNPGFQLSDEQLELIIPRNFAEACGRQPGVPSCTPEGQFQVAAPSLPTRRVPTTEWGRMTGSLKQGQLVTGYIFGDWVQLSSWPEGHVHLEPGDEVWVQSREEDGEVLLRWLRDSPPRQQPSEGPVAAAARTPAAAAASAAVGAPSSASPAA